MLTVHHLGMSQSERIVWLCEELGVEYALKRYARRTDNMLAPDEYKALHPMGIAPVITDGDLVLGESGAICEYINQKHGGGRLSLKPDDPEFADYLFWFHWSNGTFMPTLMMAFVLSKVGNAEAAKHGFVGGRSERMWEMVEHRLGEAEFFGGSKLTLGDIMMVYSLTTNRAFENVSLEGLPNTVAYLGRIGGRPAYRRAMEKAEPGFTPLLS